MQTCRYFKYSIWGVSQVNPVLTTEILRMPGLTASQHGIDTDLDVDTGVKSNSTAFNSRPI